MPSLVPQKIAAIDRIDEARHARGLPKFDEDAFIKKLPKPRTLTDVVLALEHEADVSEGKAPVRSGPAQTARTSTAVTFDQKSPRDRVRAAFRKQIAQNR